MGKGERQYNQDLLTYWTKSFKKICGPKDDCLITCATFILRWSCYSMISLLTMMTWKGFIRPWGSWRSGKSCSSCGPKSLCTWSNINFLSQLLLQIELLKPIEKGRQAHPKNPMRLPSFRKRYTLIFIGPEYDHWLPLSVSNSLTVV